MPYQPGEILLEEYRIEALVGQGAFGEVYRVTNLGLKVPRALKILRRDAPGMGSTAFTDGQARFQLEAQLGAQLNTPTPHPNLLQVHRFKAADNLLVLEMEYAPGGSLGERIQASRQTGLPLSIEEVVQVGLGIASGLTLLHNRDVVHRDLRPSNLLFDDQNRVKIADLGLAQVPGGPSMRSQLSNAQPHPGTPEYMSPEQENSPKHLTPASDVYALGLILFEMLTNRTYKNLRVGTRARALRPETPAWLDDLLATMLSENARERPVDGSEAADLLRVPTQQQAEKEKAEQAAREAAERARLEEQNRVAAEQALQEKTVREAAEKVVREKAAREAAEKAARDKTEWEAAARALREKTARIETLGEKKEPEISGGLKIPAYLWVVVILVIGLGAIGFWPRDTAVATPMAPAAPAATDAVADPAVATANTVVGGPTESTSPTAVPAQSVFSGQVTEVTFWHAYGTGSAEEAALSKVLAAAAVDLPQYKINVLQIPFNDIYNKYRTDVSAGNGPDMFVAPNDSLGDDARAGLIADITDLTKGKLDGVGQLGVQGMTLNSRLYGVPESLKAVTLWYNKSMLPAAPMTTDGLQRFMEAGKPISINFGCYHMYGFYNAFGGQIFDSNWKVVAGSGIVDTFTYLNKLYQIQKNNGWALNDSDGLAPFTEGKLAAIINGNWAMADYKRTLGDNLAVAPLPSGLAGPAKPILGVDGYYINPNSANKEAAVAVALYLTNAKSQTVMMNEAGHVPVRTDVTITDPLIKGLVQAFNAGVTIRPQVPELAKYWSNFCGPDAIYEKGVAPAKFVTDAAAAANK